MIPWTFNLRSGDSDLEDEDETTSRPHDDTLPDTHPQQSNISSTKQVDKELEKLFGATKEEYVDYKPNPWSIAKINANARKLARNEPKPKKSWKPTSNTGPKSTGRQRFWNNAKGSSSSRTPTNAGKRSLRDSISEALRRGGPAATISPNQDPKSQAGTGVEGEPLVNLGSRQVDVVRPQPDATIALNVHRPLDQSIQLSRSSRQELTPQRHITRGTSAFVHDNSPIYNDTPRVVGSHGHLDASNGSFLDNRYLYDESAVPFQNSGDPEYNSNPSLYRTHGGPVSVNGIMHPPPQSPPNPQCRNSFIGRTPGRFRTLSPELGQDEIYQARVHLAPPYSSSPMRTGLEPSPTVQLIARFAAPKPSEAYNHSEINTQYADSNIYSDESPILPWTPSSPTIPEAKRYTPPARSQAYQPYTPERTSHAIQKKRPTTPPRRTMTRFDPDYKPFWSTLPTPPNSKLKPAANVVKTSRFHLPGSFLGSSPLSGSSGRTLYKPPALKRTHSREEGEPARKWKVIRV